MGYYFSNSLKTLTHWQSHKTGGGTKFLPRGLDFCGFILNDKKYYMPMEIQDGISESGVSLGTSNIGYPNEWYGIKFDFASMTPEYSEICKGPVDHVSGNFKYFYRAIFRLAANSKCNWSTKVLRTASPLDVTGNGDKVKSGEVVGICVPVFNIYILMNGSCDNTDYADMPDFIKKFKPGPQLKPGQSMGSSADLAPRLFRSSGKIIDGAKLIEHKKGLSYSGYERMFGCSHVNSKIYYFSGGCSGSQCFSVFTPKSSDDLNNTYMSGGSIVSPFNGGLSSKDLNKVHYGSEYVYSESNIHFGKSGNAFYNITREPAGYILTEGVLWKQPE